jgi:probable phosphoglycerate mutase
MRTIKTPFLLALIVATLQWGCATSHDKNTPVSKQELLEVFLVRHGEKVDHSRDPELSSAGYVRAATLAQLLRSVELDHIHSTDYIRTRKTAEPSAATTGLEIELYDPSDLKGFVAELKHSGGRHLVVGHSNTTPALVELLGGESGPEINEATEYDRLYMVTIGSNGEVSSVLLRYGIPYLSEY